MRHLKKGVAVRWTNCCLALVLLFCLGMAAQAREYIRTFINETSGSPVMVLGPDGSILARYAYAPFGSQLAVQSAARQRLGFVGGLKETPGLHYLKHRYYNPLLGRFYQPDPVGFLAGGATQINRYGYGINDPYRYRDASGMQSVGEQLEDAVLRNIAQGNSVTGYLQTVALTGWNLFGAENISQVFDKRGDVSAGTYAVATLEAAPLLGMVKYFKVVDSAAKETTTLYRAVTEGELKQIQATGKFAAGPNSLGGKFFAESAEHAKQWGDAMNGAGKSTILNVKLPTADANQLMRWDRLDGIGPARYGELEQLINSVIRCINS